MLCYLQCKDVSPELRLLLGEYLLRVGVVFGVTQPALTAHLQDASGGVPCGALQQLLQLPPHFYSEQLRTVSQVAQHLSLKEEAPLVVLDSIPGAEVVVAAASPTPTVTSFVLKNYSEL